RLGIAFGGPHAVVEPRHVPAAVLVLRDLALERGVVQRMVLDLHRHPLHRGVVAGSLRDRPALERVADLQAEVVVPAAGVVQLHHEARAPAPGRRLARLRLAGLVEAALAPVGRQAHGAGGLLAQVLAHRVGGGAHLLDRVAQAVLGHPKGVGPVAQLVVGVDVDAVAVGGAGLVPVVGHGGVLQRWGAPTMRPRPSSGREPAPVSLPEPPRGDTRRPFARRRRMNAIVHERPLPTPAPSGTRLAQRLADRYGDRITGHFTIPAHPADIRPLPQDLPPALAEALRSRGIKSLYSHQADAWKAARAGRHLVVATPTASGKSLCYTLPVVAGAMEQGAKALYLFPTKALAQDQVAELLELNAAGNLGLRAATFDGDTPGDARQAIRINGD